MNNRQLSDRIGNIDDNLIYQASKPLNFRKIRTYNNIRRAASAVIAATLMLTSGAIGAVAFSKETVVEIPREIPVEIFVPVPQELDSVSFDATGLIIVMPEEWHDRYVCVINDDGNGCLIYARAVYESAGPAAGAGVLCSIGLITEQQLSPDELVNYTAGGSRYLFSTVDGTYSIQFPSDVQYDPSDPAQAQEYHDMEASLSQLQFIIDAPN